MALPLLCGAMGVSLGAVIGVSIAFLTTPSGASATSTDSAQASTTEAELGVTPNTMAGTEENSHPAAFVPVVAYTRQPAANAGGSAAGWAGAGFSSTNRTVKANPSSAARTTQDKKLAMMRHPKLRFVGVRRRSVKPVAKLTVVQSLAGGPEVTPVTLSDAQMSLDDDAKPSGFYSEGDLTVADYDATVGTIQTDDGRTFALGTTVSASNATPWKDYRSNVHYRCGQDGSCVLVRAGVIASNARLI
ncbi:MAG: hypothetical protein ABSG10_10235 [Terracidiphilus sp.]